MIKPSGNSNIIVSDMDDVIVDLAPKWIFLAAQAFKDKYPTLAAINSIQAARSAAFMRSNFLIQHSMQEFFGMTDAEVKDVEALWRDSSDFYDELIPTDFAKGLVFYLNHTPGAKLHILTHMLDVGDKVAESKKRWLDNVFEHYIKRGSVEYHLINATEKKADFIREHFPVIQMFADDALSNITGVLLDEKITVDELMVPNFHYNRFDESIIELALRRKISLQRYEVKLHAEMHKGEPAMA